MNRSRLLHDVEHFLRGSHSSEFNGHDRIIRIELSEKLSESPGKLVLFNRRAGADENRHDLCLKSLANFFESLQQPTGSGEELEAVVIDNYHWASHREAELVQDPLSPV